MIARQDSTTVTVLVYMDDNMDTGSPLNGDSQMVPTCGQFTKSLPVPAQTTYSAMGDFNDGAAVGFLGELTLAAPQDDKLAAATRAALETGTMTPLIKEELKYSIQSRRLKEGKAELVVDFEEAQPSELTAEEVVKVEKRRIQNRQAARRFRDRQKDKGTYLKKLCEKLEASNTSLRHDLDLLRQERDSLREVIMEHLAVCPHGQNYQVFP